MVEKARGMDGMTDYLVQILGETKGEITDEIRALFKEKFPDHLRIPGPKVTVARRRLGLDLSKWRKPSAEKKAEITAKTRSTAAKITQAQKIMLKYQQLLQKQVDLEERLEKVNAAIERYKPVVNNLNEFVISVDKFEKQSRNGEDDPA